MTERDREELRHPHSSEHQAVGPEPFDPGPAQPVPDDVGGKNLSPEFIVSLGQNMEQQEPRQTPQGLVQKRGVDRLRQYIA